MKRLKYKNFIVAVMVALALFMSFALSGCAGNKDGATLPYLVSINYLTGENGSINGRSTQTIKYGEDAESVTAVPKRGYKFTGWSDGIKEATRQDKSITEYTEITANFEITNMTVTFRVNGPGRIEG